MTNWCTRPVHAVLCCTHGNQHSIVRMLNEQGACFMAERGVGWQCLSISTVRWIQLWLGCNLNSRPDWLSLSVTPSLTLMQAAAADRACMRLSLRCYLSLCWLCVQPVIGAAVSFRLELPQLEAVRCCPLVGSIPSPQSVCSYRQCLPAKYR